MEATGGCNCGELRYSVSGAVEVSLQCHYSERSIFPLESQMWQQHLLLQILSILRVH